MTQVGIIMSTYNGAKYISTQLRSILDQSHRKLTVTIADDESSDTTLDIVDAMAATDPRIAYKKNQINVGVNRSFQTAIRAAPASDFYCLSDQDDIWPLDRLEKFVRSAGNILNTASSPTGPALFVCQFETFDDTSGSEKGLSSADLLFLNRPGIDWKTLLLAGNSLYGCCFFFNHALRELIEDIPEGRTTHDYWIALVAAYTGKINILPFTGTLYRQHTNNASYGAPSRNWLVKLRRIRRSLKEDIRARQDMRRLFSELLIQHRVKLKDGDQRRIALAADAYDSGGLRLFSFQVKHGAWRMNGPSNILRVLACAAQFARFKP